MMSKDNRSGVSHPLRECNCRWDALGAGRIGPPSQNGQNRRPARSGTSRYKGVWLERGRRKWRAAICHQGRTTHVGYYDYEADAAIAYDDKAIELFGEFACLNVQCRPEIKQWLEQAHLFPPTIYDAQGTMDDGGSPPQADPVAVACTAQKRPIFP